MLDFKVINMPKSIDKKIVEKYLQLQIDIEIARQEILYGNEYNKERQKKINKIESFFRDNDSDISVDKFYKMVDDAKLINIEELQTKINKLQAELKEELKNVYDKIGELFLENETQINNDKYGSYKFSYVDKHDAKKDNIIRFSFLDVTKKLFKFNIATKFEGDKIILSGNIYDNKDMSKYNHYERVNTIDINDIGSHIKIKNNKIEIIKYKTDKINNLLGQLLFMFANDRDDFKKFIHTIIKYVDLSCIYNGEDIKTEDKQEMYNQTKNGIDELINKLVNEIYNIPKVTSCHLKWSYLCNIRIDKITSTEITFKNYFDKSDWYELIKLK